MVAALPPRSAEDGQSSAGSGLESGGLHPPDESGAHQTPSAPLDVETLIVSSRFVTLRWKEPEKTHGPIVGYSVFYRQQGSERYVIKISINSKHNN